METFNKFRKFVREKTKEDFEKASLFLEDYIFNLSHDQLLCLIKEIGVIPEDIGHDSKEEKLYTKASDILFAKALNEMNFSVQVLKQRSDCADIKAQSKYHQYSLVGDAKAFRLSRTAKNAKDFKVESMDHWRDDCDYSVLVCPYYQYPKNKSQIFKTALNRNVSLFSWEYLYILLNERIKETSSFCLKELWNQSAVISREVIVSESENCFISKQDKNIREIISLKDYKFEEYFHDIFNSLVRRGQSEIDYYESEKNRIRQLSREDAINELLVCVKIDSKIDTIKKFIGQYSNGK